MEFLLKLAPVVDIGSGGGGGTVGIVIRTRINKLSYTGERYGTINKLRVFLHILWLVSLNELPMLNPARRIDPERASKLQTQSTCICRAGFCDEIMNICGGEIVRTWNVFVCMNTFSAVVVKRRKINFATLHGYSAKAYQCKFCCDRSVCAVTAQSTVCVSLDSSLHIVSTWAVSPD